LLSAKHATSADSGSTKPRRSKGRTGGRNKRRQYWGERSGHSRLRGGVNGVLRGTGGNGLPLERRHAILDQVDSYSTIRAARDLGVKVGDFLTIVHGDGAAYLVASQFVGEWFDFISCVTGLLHTRASGYKYERRKQNIGFHGFGSFVWSFGGGGGFAEKFVTA
jgi:hypothetical protein